MYDRGAFKREAKEIIHTSVPHFMLVALVSYLLTTGLSTALSWLTGDGVTSSYLSGGVLSLFLSILIGLFSIVMDVGFANYTLCLIRREETGWGSLFQAFSYSGRALGVTLLAKLYLFLWGLLVCAAYAIYIALMLIFYFSGLDVIYIIGCILGYIAVFVVLYFIVLRYAMVPFVLAEDPSKGVLECIRSSIRMMRKFKVKLFCLDLSFLGWDLLAALISLVVLTIGFFVTNSFPLLEAIYKQNSIDMVYRLSTELVGRLAPWALLGQLAALPLNLWLLVYRTTTYARFYNYVGGYDYHQYMLAHPPQVNPEPPRTWTPSVPEAGPSAGSGTPPQQPAEPPKEPPQSILPGGYYTPVSLPEEPAEEEEPDEDEESDDEEI